MKVSLRWLRDYAAIDATAAEVARTLADTGTEVGEIEDVATGIVVARVLHLEPVPGSRHGLQLADLDVGQNPPPVLAELGIEARPLRVVTGAPNVREGDLVPYAPPRTTPPGMEEPLGVRTIHGHRSPGMLLSAIELGTGEDADGLLILEQGAPGQPVQEVLGLDTALDLEVTTNRPDCLCHLGIARELAAAFEEQLTEPETDIPAEHRSAMAATQRASVRVDDPSGCPRFVAAVIEDVRVVPSPPWMQDRLHAVGLRPINNIVDATNFVAHELGQPLHAFDLDKLCAAAGTERAVDIVVRRARDAERLRTLDGVERELQSGDMVVCSGDVAVSLAGVMGGAATAVDEGTRNVLLEGATWDGPMIRATSRRLALRSDASALFEKGLSDTLPPAAVSRAARLIVQSGGGHVLAGEVDAWPRPLDSINPVVVTSDHISSLLGMPVDATDAATVLARLGFAVEQDGSTLTVLPPPFRRDVSIKEDVIEEVGRILGYGRVPSTLPGRRVTSTATAPAAQRDDAIRAACTGAGFDEAITYSFISRELATRVAGLGGTRTPIALQNPLSEEWTVLRTSQLPGLCSAIALNVHRGTQSPALFEVGRVFWEGDRTEPPPGSRDDDPPLPPLPAEPLVLSIAAHTAGDGQAAAALLRRVQALFAWLIVEHSGEEAAVRMERVAGARAGRAALLRMGERDAGLVAELDAATVESFDVRGRIVVGELNLDVVLPQAPRAPRFGAPPRLPGVVQDLAVTVPADTRAGDALQAVRSAGAELLADAVLYDEYRGPGVAQERKGWTFRLTYRATDRTLTTEDAQAAQARVVAVLRERCGAELRI